MKQSKKDVVAMCASRSVPLPAEYIEFGARYEEQTIDVAGLVYSFVGYVGYI